jgi:hypothetical protein
MFAYTKHVFHMSTFYPFEQGKKYPYKFEKSMSKEKGGEKMCKMECL